MNFVETKKKDLEVVSVLRVAHIKSLHKNYFQYLGMKAFEYWVEKLQNKSEYLQIFTINLILEGISIY